MSASEDEGEKEPEVQTVIENIREGEGEGEGEGEMDGVQGEEEDDDPPPPPPPEEDKELLFLIEFLVDTLKLIPENMNIENLDPCALSGPTSVILTFLHFPPMFIREKDIGGDKPPGCDFIEFNMGKSLMFALTESQFEEPPPVFLLVSALKEMPHAFRFPELNIGKTKIQLSELFKQVFDKYDENPDKTVSKSIKDKYDLFGDNNKTVGEVCIYIRLTCLGENIVTEFQKGEDSGEPLLFKNKESRKVYECKSTEKPEDKSGRLLPGWSEDKKKGPCESTPQIRPPDPADEDFEEIFAEINGSAITVKVEKSRRRDPPKEFHVTDFCDCEIPLPQNLVAGMSDLSLSPASHTNMNFQGGGGGGGDPIKTDKRVGKDQANQLVFQVPPAEFLAKESVLPNTITYNVKTCQEGEKHGHKGKNSFRIITDNNYDGAPPKMPNDPDKDVFILRIMKKGRKDNGKDALDLEFRTPKEKIVPPYKPPYMVERAAGPEKSKKDGKKKKKKA